MPLASKLFAAYGLVLLLVAFCPNAALAGGKLTGVNLAMAWAYISSPILALLAQSIFVLNLLQAIARNIWAK